MDYRMTRGSAPRPYQRVGWFGCSQTSVSMLQNGNACLCSAAQYIFHPGGGRELKGAQMETFLYVLSGQISVRTAEEQKILSSGDAIHLLTGCLIGLFNESSQDCSVLAVHCKEI